MARGKRQGWPEKCHVYEGTKKDEEKVPRVPRFRFKCEMKGGADGERDKRNMH